MSDKAPVYGELASDPVLVRVKRGHQVREAGKSYRYPDEFRSTRGRAGDLNVDIIKDLSAAVPRPSMVVPTEKLASLEGGEGDELRRRVKGNLNRTYKGGFDRQVG